MFATLVTKARSAVLVGASLAVASGVLLGAGTASAQITPIHRIITLTTASDGKTVSADVGDQVKVELSGGQLRWSEASVVPTTLPPAVLVKESGRTSSTGSSVTTFLVVSPGSARLEATGTPLACGPGTVCPLFIREWQATVDVPFLPSLP